MRMPRLKFIVRLMIGGVAMLFIWGISVFDGWSYRDAANHYRHYAEAYEDNDPQGNHYASCYGETWDTYSKKVETDRKSRQLDVRYRTSQVTKYRKLQRKYEHAASRPWPWLRLTLAPPLRP